MGLELTTARMGMVLEELAMAVHSGNITAIVPEDLELEAHSTLWSETDSTELTLLKLVPSVPATSITHEYTRINSFGYDKNSGFFDERSLPPETNFGSARIEVPIKLMGEVGPTFLLAALEKTQKALGTQGAQNIERTALRLNVLRKKNRNLFFSDTRVTREGTSSQRFKGILQLIQEGTDGTSGTSPFGDHVIDMEGAPLTVDTVRDKIAKGIQLFGRMTCLIMDPFARSDFEASLDAAHRLGIPNQLAPYMIGQSIGGIQTQGGVTFFETDNVLSAQHSRWQYTATLVDGAPSGTPTVSVAAGAPGAGETSVWDAATVGDIYWVVTEVVSEKEGLGTRFPTALASYTAVTAGQKATLTITPSSPQVESCRIYRGRSEDGDDALVDAYFIYEVATAASGAQFTSADLNQWRPNTTCAFGLRIVSASERALHTPRNDGTLNMYEHARANSDQYFGMPDVKQNTVAVANLGPTMGILALASLLPEVDRPLVYSACAPEVRNPFQNFVFKNIGRA